ncbi:competence type IV pilus ATPase ComGA [Apilactobacillus xinyiensis]|uniref:competence type IV pilus ATPase ComGA n=1 Tax=Apilactobacillus xinyiensis TaxID=2841032 RepID=UPI0031FF22B2
MIENLFNQILKAAYTRKVSDIYILPKDNYYEIKFRGPTFNEFYNSMTNKDAQQLINFCKYTANMSVSEHRRPQMGSGLQKINSENVYLRFSSVGDFRHRDSMVIRILYKSVDCKYYDKSNNPIELLKHQCLSKGIVIFAGPTGSGKTTSIYNLAKHYGKNKMVMTIEDPIEIHEEDFLQLQVNASSNMKYDDLLKVGLRNRPDIFIVGEIRDEYTAEVATKAALSGHLVLSTVHANNHNGVIKRLLKLGINEDYLKYAINAVVYQNLISDVENKLYLLATVATNEDLFNNQRSDEHYNIEWNQKLDELLQNKRISTKIYNETIL